MVKALLQDFDKTLADGLAAWNAAQADEEMEDLGGVVRRPHIPSNYQVALPSPFLIVATKAWTTLPCCLAQVLEMAGACWVLPEFQDRLGKDELVTTLRGHLDQRLSIAAGDITSRGVVMEDSIALIRDLWGPGGSVIFVDSNTRSVPWGPFSCSR